MGEDDEIGTGRAQRMKAISSLAKALQNPLAIFGLVLVCGGGPLTTAYALSPTLMFAGIALIALIVFVLGMAAVFCYLVVFRPRHLYHPTEIPVRAYSTPIYTEAAVGTEKEIRRKAQKLARSVLVDLFGQRVDDETLERTVERLTNAARLHVAQDVRIEEDIETAGDGPDGDLRRS